MGCSQSTPACFPELMDCHGSWASVHCKCPQRALSHPLTAQIPFGNPGFPFLGSQVCKGDNVVLLSPGGARRQNMPSTARCLCNQSQSRRFVSNVKSLQVFLIYLLFFPSLNTLYTLPTLGNTGNSHHHHIFVYLSHSFLGD